MIRYTSIVFLFLISLSTFSEETVKQEIKPQIGSIDDSGRVDPEEFEFSNTEDKLWMDKHLLNIKKPARLHYEFEKTGSYEDGFIDDVYLDIVKVNKDGTRDTVLDFFSAERRQAISPSNVTNITGNPVIGIYLQGDVYEMNRLTDGHWKYFLREIKLAMADSHTSDIININLDGRQYKGEKIILRPFDNVKNKQRLKEFSDKRYEFILSNEIPGKLYQIKTVINDKADPENPLIEEVLTLKNVELDPKAEAKK